MYLLSYAIDKNFGKSFKIMHFRLIHWCPHSPYKVGVAYLAYYEMRTGQAREGRNSVILTGSCLGLRF